MSGSLNRGVLWVGIVLVIGALGAAPFFLDGQGRGTSNRGPVQVSESFVAQSLKDLVAESDAVVEGTVIRVEPGRVVDLGEDNVVEFEQVSLRIDRILIGSVASDVVLVEEYYDSLQWPWREGLSGLFFLHLKHEPLPRPLYRLTSTQGRFDLSIDGVTASNDAEAWVKELENLTPAEFEEEVAQTVATLG